MLWVFVIRQSESRAGTRAIGSAQNLRQCLTNLRPAQGIAWIFALVRCGARYFQKFVEGYAAAGVKVRAVTTQNEIDADQGGRMPACPWPEEDEERLVAALGPLLEASGTKILDARSQLQFVGPRAGSTLEAPVQEIREHCSLARVRGKPGDDG